MLEVILLFVGAKETCRFILTNSGIKEQNQKENGIQIRNVCSIFFYYFINTFYIK